MQWKRELLCGGVTLCTEFGYQCMDARGMFGRGLDPSPAFDFLENTVVGGIVIGLDDMRDVFLREQCLQNSCLNFIFDGCDGLNVHRVYPVVMGSTRTSSSRVVMPFLAFFMASSARVSMPFDTANLCN